MFSYKGLVSKKHFLNTSVQLDHVALGLGTWNSPPKNENVEIQWELAKTFNTLLEW